MAAVRPLFSTAVAVFMFYIDEMEDQHFCCCSWEWRRKTKAWSHFTLETRGWEDNFLQRT